MVSFKTDASITRRGSSVTPQTVHNGETPESYNLWATNVSLSYIHQRECQHPH